MFHLISFAKSTTQRSEILFTHSRCCFPLMIILQIFIRKWHSILFLRQIYFICKLLKTKQVTCIKSNKYQLDSIERRKAFEQNRGNTMKTLSTSHPSGFGLTFSLDKV